MQHQLRRLAARLPVRQVARRRPLGDQSRAEWCAQPDSRGVVVEVRRAGRQRRAPQRWQRVLEVVHRRAVDGLAEDVATPQL
eukprot:7379922-Prymnesium_polylepis.1